MSEGRAARPRSLPLAAVLLAATLAFLLLIPPAHARTNAAVSVSPTGAGETHCDVVLGKAFALKLVASTSVPTAFVLIQPAAGLPKGATLQNKTSGDGNVARATLAWTPADVGRYTLRFGASS